MQTSNLLSLPFRRATHVDLSQAITSHVQSRFNQHISGFESDLRAIETLRKDSINANEVHYSGVVKLQRYAAQLVFLCTKFPDDVGAQ